MRVLLLAVLALLLASCSRKTYPQTERIVNVTDTVYRARTDTLRLVTERLDSVIVRDSVCTLVKGDTVVIREWHFRDRVGKVSADTYKASADTAWRTRIVDRYITRTVCVAVPRQPSWWETAQVYVGRAAIVLAALWLAWRAVKRYLRKQVPRV